MTLPISIIIYLMLKTLPLLSRFSPLSFYMMKKVTDAAHATETAEELFMSALSVLCGIHFKTFYHEKYQTYTKVEK